MHLSGYFGNIKNPFLTRFSGKNVAAPDTTVVRIVPAAFHQIGMSRSELYDSRLNP